MLRPTVEYIEIRAIAMPGPHWLALLSRRARRQKLPCNSQTVGKAMVDTGGRLTTL